MGGGLSATSLYTNGGGRMKNYSIILSFLFILTSYTYSIAQVQTYLGIYAGYGMLNMKEVNDDLKDTYDAIRSFNIPISSPEDITGGLFLDGSLTFQSNKFLFGAEVNYISSSGNITYNDFTGSLEEKYDVNTIEFLGILGVKVPISELTSLVFKGYAGYGLASVEHNAAFIFYSSPSDNIIVKHEVDGGYFSSRLQGGFDFNINPVVISISVGYRIANSGQLKGSLTQDGTSYDNMGIRNTRGNDIEFDFTGVTFMGGFQFLL